jgi:hypothetical protein
MPVEFGELRRFLDWAVWTSVKPSAKSSPTPGAMTTDPQASTRDRAVFYFVLFVAAVCIISNLTGPTIAVLPLPTFVRREVQLSQTQAFTDIAASKPSRNIDILSSCNVAKLTAGQYSCTSSVMENTLDPMLVNVGNEQNANIADLN